MTYTQDRGEGSRLTNNKCGPAGGAGRDLQCGPLCQTQHSPALQPTDFSQNPALEAGTGTEAHSNHLQRTRHWPASSSLPRIMEPSIVLAASEMA
jgi:hypothetical protein